MVQKKLIQSTWRSDYKIGLHIWGLTKYHVLIENYDYKARQMLQLDILWQTKYTIYERKIS